MLDFHSHILPGIDDGSASLEQSVAMLREEARQGIGCVIATPHFYPRRNDLDTFLEKRAEAERLLRQEMEKHENMPRLLVGAEVQYFPGMGDSQVLEKLTIAGTHCVLVEMPMDHWTDRMYRELEKLSILQGLVPVVAHIDRYIRPWHTKGIPGRLAALPVLVQANGSFFLKRKTRSLAMKLLKKGQIHLLGSDAHNMDDRVPNLGAVRTVLSDEQLRFIRENQRMALDK